MHRLLRRPLSTPSFTEAAARLVRGATKANREARGATKPNRDAAPRRPEATHKRASSIVQRKAEARVEHALAAAVAERRRRDAWRPPLDEVDVSAVRLSPDFREATVTWRLVESHRPPRTSARRPLLYSCSLYMISAHQRNAHGVVGRDRGGLVLVGVG